MNPSTDPPTPATHTLGRGSLLEDLAPAPAAPVPHPRTPRRATARLRALWARRAARNTLLAFAGVVLLAIAVLILRPTPKPDFGSAAMNDVLNFALLTEDFNRLPVQQRLDLMKELTARLRGMSGEDSAAMAMFAAAVEGPMREQMMRNASLLAADVWDSYATQYTSVPPGDRPEFLDKTFVEFGKMLESLGGEPRDISDAKRIEEARAQSKKDAQEFKSGAGPGGGELARMSQMMQNTFGRFTPPQQQARGQQLMRDMTRHLRGEDLSTRRPTGGG